MAVPVESGSDGVEFTASEAAPRARSNAGVASRLNPAAETPI